MDRNNVIGFILIFLILMGYAYLTSPSPEELAEMQRVQDSIQIAEARTDSLAKLQVDNPTITTTNPVVENDSLRQIRMSSQYGVFAPAGSGSEELKVVENDKIKITFSTKGGAIKEVELKEYSKIILNEDKSETKIPVKLLEDEKNRFEYYLPIANAAQGSISTADLFFTPTVSGNTISMKAMTTTGGFFEQVYTLSDNGYGLDYKLNMQGLQGVLQRDAEDLQLNWVNYLDRIELNTDFEKYYSSVYYKESDEYPSYCSCRGDDEELVKKVQWVSNANQFFNSTLVADVPFTKADLEVIMTDDEDEDIKKIQSKLSIPISNTGNETIAMRMYVGPNEYNVLQEFAEDLHYVIPYGSSIVGTINRYIIRPAFNFLMGLVGMKGIVILLLTLIVKLVLFPLTYRMLYSQQKMAALKPKLAAMKEKYKDDSQKQQMEQMKMYQEYGVNPLGGCWPMALQMPIWYALFRFFPGSIDFRQASFLWANDLSSYDVAFWLPFEIPFYGAHVSLFTVLWAVSTVAYTYYNTKHMDMSGPNASMMKYMQYGMPIMFLFFFNNYAAGLTCYMFFSNLLNVTQTLVTKNFLIDHDKIQQELEAAKKKPKKKGGFRQRLEEAMKEQQRIQAEQEKKKKKR